MNTTIIKSATACFAMMVLAGCASVPRDAGFKEVQTIVAQRTGQLVQWRGNSADDVAVDHAVDALLIHELTADQAVQVALLNNLDLQATYEDLGIAQADLVQAGLLKNPTLSIERRFRGQAAEIDVAQDFLDLLALPMRKKMAEAQFEEARLHVAHEVLQLTTDVKIAYYTCQAREQLLQRLRLIVDLNKTAAELARRQHEAGTLNELDTANLTVIYDQSKVEVALAETQLTADRERLNRLMGLWGAQTTWKIAPQLPALPTTEISLHGLESLAVSARLDLAQRRRQIESAAQALGITQTFRYIPVITLSAHYEHEVEPEHSFGPAVEIGIPLFDQGQAQVARGKALLAQNQRRYAALAIEIRSKVRESRDRMIAQRNLAEYYKGLLQQRLRILNLTLLQYNGMFKSPYDLLLAKQQEAATEQAYIDAWRDYWIARTELEREMGGRLPANEPPSGVKP
ncbi:MAG: TolC family protein [Phycisphaerales bacterium]|jgi:cobalt-zinc-cadmium efflux system outer membrane protein|nr:TolC family protein [Phycisphaerales bacterium]